MVHGFALGLPGVFFGLRETMRVAAALIRLSDPAGQMLRWKRRAAGFQ